MADRLTNARLIDLWEEGQRYPPYQVALLLVTATIADNERQQLADWTIGQRDRHLLQLRSRLFGDSMACLARCPNCGEQVEFSLSVQDLLALEVATDAENELVMGDYQVSFRVPTIADLDWAMNTDNPSKSLLERVIMSVNSEAMDEVMSDELLLHLAEKIDEHDALANIQLALSCAECGTQWQSVFDIMTYLWREIGAWVNRILGEVHIIASTYGWTEQVILNLSANRRQTYLDLILGTS